MKDSRIWLAWGRCLTRSLMLFTLMILAASARPVDLSVHLCTWPNRPLQRQRDTVRGEYAELTNSQGPLFLFSHTPCGLSCTTGYCLSPHSPLG